MRMKLKLSEFRSLIKEELTKLHEGPYSAHPGARGFKRPERPERGRSAKGKIAFPTRTALAIWKAEILGQMSDGMWENTQPSDHWYFWQKLTPVLGKPATVATEYPVKNSYNLPGLIEVVGDRMIATGKMALAAPNATERDNVSQYMPPTFEEFMKLKAPGYLGDSDYRKKYFDTVSPELAQKFYAATYTEKDLRKDLSLIRMAMKNVSVSHDAESHEPEQVKELPPAGADVDTSGGKTYKVYGKKGSGPAHTRYKGKAYVAGQGTAFKSGDSATVAPEGDKLRVKKPESDHTQLWEPEA